MAAAVGSLLIAAGPPVRTAPAAPPAAGAKTDGPLADRAASLAVRAAANPEAGRSLVGSTTSPAARTAPSSLADDPPVSRPTSSAPPAAASAVADGPPVSRPTSPTPPAAASAEAAAAQQSLEVPSAALETPLTAEPLSPDSVLRFPHLNDFVGDILLGAGDVQVVLAGVPPAPVASPWQPGISAVFVRHGGRWVRHAALPNVSLQTASALHGPLLPVHALAVDLGRSAAPAAVYASFIYGSSADQVEPAGAARHPADAGGDQRVATWRLDAATLSLTFAEFNAGEQGPRGHAKSVVKSRSGPWRLRLPSAAGQLLAPAKYFGDAPGAPFLLRYKGSDVAAIIGYRPLLLSEFGTELGPIEPAGPAAPLMEGYEFLLTPAAVAQVWRRAAVLRSCLTGTHEPRVPPPPEAKLDWLAGCQPQLPATGISLTMASDEPARQTPQPVFVFGADGALLHYIPVSSETIAAAHEGAAATRDGAGADADAAGSSDGAAAAGGVAPRQSAASGGLTLALPAGKGYQLADTAAGRRLGSLKPVDLPAGTVAAVQVPARAVGQLQISRAKTAGSLFVVIEPTNAAAGDAQVLEAHQASGEAPPQLLPQLWLVSSPPFSASLLAGDYRIALIAGRDGVLCREYAQIKAGRRLLFRCPKDRPPPLPATTRFADLVALPAPTTESAANTQRALSAALGVDLIGAGDELAAAGQPPAVPLLAVAGDEATLQFWPATASLRARWQQALRSQPADVLSRFARFLHDEGDPGVIELGCPFPGITPDAYAAQVRRFKPTAVRLFGCPSPIAEAEWTALWARLAPSSSPPLLLTAASARNLADAQTFLPRLSFEVAAAQESAAQREPEAAGKATKSAGAKAVPDKDPSLPDDAGKDLVALKATAAGLHHAAANFGKERAFTLSGGAVVFLRALKPSVAKGRTGARASTTELDLSLSLAQLGGTQALELSVFTEQGQVKHVLLPASEAPRELVTVPSLRLGSASWLRLEVRGMPAPLLSGFGSGPGPSSPARQGRLLAATQFTSIASLRFAEGAL